MGQALHHFWLAETGQDLAEYSLILCFVALATFFLLGMFEPSINTIWGASNNHLDTANRVAAGQAP
ncbi:MAG TPA: hypothetical protein VG675_23770 [Bryobacteraceae bacterium]|nr:hypothetical protein [Bryobacteraceae bacterium]